MCLFNQTRLDKTAVACKIGCVRLVCLFLCKYALLVGVGTEYVEPVGQKIEKTVRKLENTTRK